jgi:histidinol-phosphate aminotransferase
VTAGLASGATATAISTAGAAAPAAYAWEPTNEQIAERYGVPIDRILRFDLNTAPATPALAAEVMARGGFESPLCEYPPADYRRLVEAAAAAYGCEASEVLVGAGADEILDLAARAFLPPGGAAVIPTPTYAMYRVITEQRGARVIDVPRRRDGWALDIEATAAAAIGADLVWLCSPNNPTAQAEPDGAIEMLLGRLEHAAERDGTRPPTVVLDEAYAEFAGRSLLELRGRHPNLVVVRTASKAYALAGLRVGFAIAAPATIAAMAPYRPPASVSVVSAAIVAAALRDGQAMRDTVARVQSERRRLSGALGDRGWRVAPSVTNFLLADFGAAERAARVARGLLERGLVPRTFAADHPLAGSLRLTVRDAAGNDRLIAAAREIGP